MMPNELPRRSSRRSSRRLALGLLIAACIAPAEPARAQLRLPGASLPSVNGLPAVIPQIVSPLQPEALAPRVPLQDLRRSVVRALLRDHAGTIEADPAGEPVVRGELLLVSPRPATIASALAQGYRLVRESLLEGLGERMVVLEPPSNVSTAQGLAQLRSLDPDLDVDFNHIYTRSGNLAEAATSAPGAAPAGSGSGAGRRVGLIDSGVDVGHPALREAQVRAWGCGAVPVPSPHGTAIASLLVGRHQAFVAVAAGATLFAADTYCGEATGGSAERVAQALAWLAREQVAVINISLVGPANRLLERSAATLFERGYLIVAAVGNDGPAAPPLYPAAYGSVIGVTAVATTRRILPEAAQGVHVAFAAPGADIAVARSGTRGYGVARGTSFAAPVVAGLLADVLREPDPLLARRAVQSLAGMAVDLGAPGRDGVFGWGLVGEQARVAPERVHALTRLAD